MYSLVSDEVNVTKLIKRNEAKRNKTKFVVLLVISMEVNKKECIEVRRESGVRKGKRKRKWKQL